MPLLNIRETDLFHLVAEQVTTEEWFAACRPFQVTNDEMNLVQRLQAETIRLQVLLKKIQERPEVDLDSMTEQERASWITGDEFEKEKEQTS